MNRENFAKPELISGILMTVSLILAIGFSNISYFSELYIEFIYYPLSVGLGPFIYQTKTINLINDVLMTLFFLVIGLELKYHLSLGEYQDRKTLILPIASAIGGIVVPAAFYLYFNWNTPTAKGWAIPIATDTAFMLGTLSFFSRYIPAKLRAFILAFSLMDDMLALCILAVFYTKTPNVNALIASGFFLIILSIMNFKNIKSTVYYLTVGIFLWLAMAKAGIHGTLAGAILALTIPVKINNRLNPSFHQLEHNLRPLVYYIILPIFIFVNSGIHFDGLTKEMLLSDVSLGIILGLFLGKQLGIAGFSYFSIKMKWCTLPPHVNWQKFYSIAILGGIGFTLSLFIGDLTFETGEPHYAMRAAIIIGSILSAVVGLTLFIHSLSSFPHHKVPKKDGSMPHKSKA